MRNLNHPKPTTKQFMKSKYIHMLITLVMAASAHAQTQVGTLAIANTVGGTTVRYDPDTGTLNTQNAGGPVNITSSFIGYSQNQNGTTDTSDIGLNSFSTAFSIFTLSTANSTSFAGAAQWSFDLSPLDSYLSANSLAAAALSLNLAFTQNNSSGNYDVYLSYTGDGMTLTPLDTTAAGNYTDFFVPGNSANVGDVVNGKFKVIAQNAGGANTPFNDSIDLLSLYNSGVKQFDLMLVSATYGPGGKYTVSKTGNGIFLTTAAVPEPSSAALLSGLGLIGLLLRRRRS
jgi:hypothetical protein